MILAGAHTNRNIRRYWVKAKNRIVLSKLFSADDNTLPADFPACGREDSEMK